MGAFHYKLQLLPRSFFKSEPPAAFTDDEIGHAFDLGWSKSQPSREAMTRIRSLLPNNNSNGENEEFISGDNWGSDIRIYNTDGKVLAIYFRFSPIKDSWHLMEQFLSIAQGEGYLLLDQKTGMIIEPEEREVKERFKISTAAQFMHDPQGTVIRAADEI
jgi:hypothetical protein